MKKIITLISTVLVFVSCSKDKPIGGPVPEPGYDMWLYQYKSLSLEDKIIVEYRGENVWRVCGKGEKDSCLIAMKDNLYLGNMDISGSPRYYAVIDRNWGTYSSSDKSFYSDDDILERQIFSRFYRIPRRAVPTLVEKFPISEHYPENIDFINALIDSGSIEQYRVDLGY
ncbi:MAG: hypothetical protein J6Z12_00800 [Paludibacteraceae bacterium]|nr:hypothetical protein [Paludibacteraceae bacterium]